MVRNRGCKEFLTFSDMTDGISFMCRARNEEETLEKSIRSLFNLTCPHEINIILHRCTDNSENIARNLAKENPNINVIIYNNHISRAGYETLATDENSENSIVTYYNYCLKQSKFPWSFKWDADFLASTGLIDYLNSKRWSKANHAYTIEYKSTQHASAEVYLFPSSAIYKKFIFWELLRGYSGIMRLNSDQYLEHCSELSNIKSYWKEQPWYMVVDSEEARKVRSRVEQLTRDFGSEPPGMARALNPVCDNIYLKIKGSNPSYINLYN